ncbi:shikimate kinase [Pontibacter oryzae]|nr:shikimate kinase [Pontibacter oryzae]
MRIFLIGMMGSGKTTLGRQLAQRLGYTFVDLDEYIVRQQGQSIAELFAVQGQEHFRSLERQALQQIAAQHQQAVVATGGGAPCFFDNIDFMNRQGQTFFLDVPANQLASRLLRRGQQERPLLAGKTADELISYLTETFAHRKQFYTRAKHTLKGPAIKVSDFLRVLNL